MIRGNTSGVIRNKIDGDGILLDAQIMFGSVPYE